MQRQGILLLNTVELSELLTFKTETKNFYLAAEVIFFIKI
jgi:hypothetical protein